MKVRITTYCSFDNLLLAGPQDKSLTLRDNRIVVNIILKAVADWQIKTPCSSSADWTKPLAQAVQWAAFQEMSHILNG
jgi:hypothetical protein